jgi:cysteine desulfurase/selenocysteine lyase
MNTLPPLQGGGDMVRSVSFEKTVYAESPARFEAGTPAIIEAIGLAKAIDWLKTHSRTHEKDVMTVLKKRLAEMDDIIPLGALDTKESLVCFNLKNVHPQDLAFILDKQGVAVRVGHHCAQPITEHFGVTGSVRASLGIYNDEEDIERFIQALKKAKDMLL